jgi:hypothetical protein
MSMSNPFKGKTATKVLDLSDKMGLKTAVRYHDTNVVEFTPDTITLNSGGWLTATTKRRMNETASAYGLDFWVSQEDFKWWVGVGPDRKPIPFSDGMTFKRP